MISTAFVYLAYYLLTILLTVFPSSTGFPPEIATAVTQVGGYTAIINAVFPLDVLSDVVIAVITFELIIFAFKTIRFVFGYVPLVGK